MSSIASPAPHGGASRTPLSGIQYLRAIAAIMVSRFGVTSSRATASVLR